MSQVSITGDWIYNYIISKFRYVCSAWHMRGHSYGTYAVREHRPLYHMRNGMNGSNRESNPRPQRQQARH
jgi:hypothetical protein